MEGQTEAMKTRIYVGGLGERVTEEDLRKTFSNLGSVEAVDIIRTKGRSFAYINFLPSSQNSLAKLFSMVLLYPLTIYLCFDVLGKWVVCVCCFYISILLQPAIAAVYYSGDLVI